MMTTLIEVADAKVMLGIPAEDTTQDLKLAASIGVASELIEVYLRRKLRYGEHTDTAWQQGECLWLRAYPVDVIIEMTSGDTTLAIPTSLCAEAGLLRRKDGMPWAHLPEGYTVRYMGGLATIPAAIQQACLMLVKQIDASLENGGGVAAQERLGDYSITYAQPTGTTAADGSLDAFGPAIVALLRPWMGRRV